MLLPFRLPVVLTILLAVLALLPIHLVAGSDPEPQFVTVPAFVAAVKRELSAAQDVVLSELRLELKTVKLKMSVAAVKGVDGKIALGIVPVGMDVSAESGRIQKVSVNLQPSEPRLYRSGSEALFQRDLASLIVDLCGDLLKGLRDPPRFDPERLVIEIVFGVKQSIEGGGVKLVVLEFGSEAAVQDEGIQSLSLRFERVVLPR